MKDQQLAKLTADLRKLGRELRAFDMSAHLAATRGPKLSPWDKRQTIIIVCGGPRGSLL